MWFASTYAQLKPKLIFEAACWKRWGLVTNAGSLSSESPIAESDSWK